MTVSDYIKTQAELLKARQVAYRTVDAAERNELTAKADRLAETIAHHTLAEDRFGNKYLYETNTLKS